MIRLAPPPPPPPPLSLSLSHPHSLSWKRSRLFRFVLEIAWHVCMTVCTFKGCSLIGFPLFCVFPLIIADS